MDWWMMKGKKDRYKDGNKYRWTDGWMDGCIYGWMDEGKMIERKMDG